MSARPFKRNPTGSVTSPGVILVLLTVLTVFNMVDRQILFVLAEPIKRDLRLSDTDIGLLGGVAFSLIYAVAALPLAWVADRFSRRTVLSICVVLWSVMTGLGSVANSFLTLALTRCGVALGEAGGTPISQSIVAEVFPVERRARALSVMQAGIAVGIMVGSAGGGWLASQLDWRAVMVIVAVPSLLLAPLCLRLLPDATRGAQAPAGAGFIADVGHLLSLPSFLPILLGVASYSFATFGGTVFGVAFMIRVHGMSIAQAGLAFGLITGLVGLAGTVGWGILADLARARDHRAPLRLAAGACLASVPFYLLAWWASSVAVMLIAFAAAWLLTCAFLPISHASAQNASPPHLRALAAALVLFAMSMIGNVASSTVAGALSDALRPLWGTDGLRIALSILSLAGLASAGCYLLAARAVGNSARTPRAHQITK